MTRRDVEGKSVIEVGGLSINGSLRPIVESLGPAKYIGVDLTLGPGVDAICKAEDLVRVFGIEVFDVIIATELLEHVKDWRRVVSNMKQVIRPGGVLLVTTRSSGAEYHGYPFDFWRYEMSDMEEIFSEFHIDTIEPDPLVPGVFMKAIKRTPFVEKDTRGIKLFSILKGRRVEHPPLISSLFIKTCWDLKPYMTKILPRCIKKLVKKALTAKKLPTVLSALIKTYQ
jgi:SAM-dependent methyltransferase